MTANGFRPAWWLPGAHLRTLWRKFVPPRSRAPERVERWVTPDGDFLEIYRLDAPATSPRIIMLHGLEGSPRSHYSLGTFEQARQRGWAADAMVFRSCGAELNRCARFYHSGETGDLEFVVTRLIAEAPDAPVILAGYSLGGNVLLKWLGERGSNLPSQVRAAAAVSVPFDLARASRYINRGFSRIYERHFLRSLRRKAVSKHALFPDIPAPEVISRARTMWDFDDVVTAPVHGFRDAQDYYTQSSSLSWLRRIELPTLLLSAADDPFLPPAVLDEVSSIARENPALHIEFVDRGGHVGFVGGSVPWKPFYYAEWRVAEFLATKL